VPLVSIIIPCFRQAHFLNECVGSLLAQTMPDWEAVIVNDGSPDNSREVACRLMEQDPRVRYVERPNGGLSAARNTGVDAAQGKLLLFLDSDDWLDESALARHLTVREGAIENLVTVSGWWELPAPDGVTEAFAAPSFCGAPLHQYLSRNQAPCHAHMVPRAAVLESGGFKPSLRSHEDWDLWIRLAAAGMRFASVPAQIAFYRKLPNSMSTNLRRMYRTSRRVLRDAPRHRSCRVCRHIVREGIVSSCWLEFHLLKENLLAASSLRDKLAAYLTLQRALVDDRDLLRCFLRSFKVSVSRVLRRRDASNVA
jgi:glycosyltransferase involved in cell wall biosynthesis